MPAEEQILKESPVAVRQNIAISLLMVEDNPQHQKLIKNVLSNGPLDISITSTNSGERGLQLVEKCHFDIILLN